MVVVPERRRGSSTRPTWSTADFAPLDAAWRRIFSRSNEPPGGSLLAQTVATASMRRPQLEHVPVFPGAAVLDLGTGYGAQLFELAHLWPIAAVGLDCDADVVASAASVVAELDGWFARGASVHFAVGCAESLPFPDRRFDVVLVRLLFQHLPDPGAVVAELRRVLRPGGVVYAFEVDDGLSITYPPPSAAHRELEEAYSVWQLGIGGDRQAGRKMANRLADAGFCVDRVVVDPQAAYLDESPSAAERSVDLTRLRAARSGIIDASLLDEARFDDLIEEFETEVGSARLRVESQIAVIARRAQS